MRTETVFHVPTGTIMMVGRLYGMMTRPTDEVKRELDESREQGEDAFKMAREKIERNARSVRRGEVKDTQLGRVYNTGLLGERNITNAFTALICDVMNGWAGYVNVSDAANVGCALANFSRHVSGTGETAESATNTYVTFTHVEPWVIGSQANPTLNTYVTVGTIVYAGSHHITEHGLFNSTNSAIAILADRTLLAIADHKDVIINDAITWTYTMTITAGG